MSVYIFVGKLTISVLPSYILGLLHERPCGCGHRLHQLLVRVPVPAGHARPQGRVGLRLRPRALPGRRRHEEVLQGPPGAGLRRREHPGLPAPEGDLQHSALKGGPAVPPAPSEGRILPRSARPLPRPSAPLLRCCHALGSRKRCLGGRKGLFYAHHAPSPPGGCPSLGT